MSHLNPNLPSASIQKYLCMRRPKDVLGFTLIELLVVFTLLALLLTIAVPRYLQSAELAREKARNQNLATIRDALDKFRADQGRYPAELDELVVKQYLRRIPLDPVTSSTNWVVVADANGKEAGVYDIAAPEAVVDATPAPSMNPASAPETSPVK